MTSLKEGKEFLDEINAALEPIMDECDGSAQGTWHMSKEGVFAVATIKWTPEGFKFFASEF